MNLIGLAELAELYGISKNSASTWSRQRNWPAPVATLKMGPVWDRDEVLQHKPLTDLHFAISDEIGFFTAKIKPPQCAGCAFPTEPEEGSLRVGSDACGDVTIDYTVKCSNCGMQAWPYFDYTEIQREARQ